MGVAGGKNASLGAMHPQLYYHKEKLIKLRGEAKIKNAVILLIILPHFTVEKEGQKSNLLLDDLKLLLHCVIDEGASIE